MRSGMGTQFRADIRVLALARLSASDHYCQRRVVFSWRDITDHINRDTPSAPMLAMVNGSVGTGKGGTRNAHGGVAPRR